MTRTLWYDILSLFRPRLSSSREKLREKNWTHKVSFDTSLRVGGPSRPKSKSTFFSLMAHFEQNSFLTCCNGLKSILSESNIWKIRFHSQSLWYTHRFVIVNLAYLRYGKLEENWQWCICNCSSMWQVMLSISILHKFLTSRKAFNFQWMNLLRIWLLFLTLRVCLFYSYPWEEGHPFCSWWEDRTHLRQLFRQPRGILSSLRCLQGWAKILNKIVMSEGKRDRNGNTADVFLDDGFVMDNIDWNALEVDQGIDDRHKYQKSNHGDNYVGRQK